MNVSSTKGTGEKKINKEGTLSISRYTWTMKLFQMRIIIICVTKSTNKHSTIYGVCQGLKYTNKP